LNNHSNSFKSHCTFPPDCLRRLQTKLSGAASFHHEALIDSFSQQRYADILKRLLCLSE
jgi:hypothetical protein